MKRILFAFIVFTSVFSLYSQEEDGLLIYRHNAKPLLVVLDDISNISHSDSIQIIDLKPEWTAKVKTPISTIDSMVFVDIDTLYNVKYACLSCPDDNHPHAIDLGLPSGTKWACCNVGASKPVEYGGYYAWGEIEEKDYYDWKTYSFCDGNSYSCYSIGDDIAGTQYDVAHVRWGDSWKMSSIEQIQELCENCSWQWLSINGINGQLVTGPNGNIIFLPASGRYFQDKFLYDGVEGEYWSSSISPDAKQDARLLSFSPNVWTWISLISRAFGQTVRAVCP